MGQGKGGGGNVELSVQIYNFGSLWSSGNLGSTWKLVLLLLFHLEGGGEERYFGSRGEKEKGLLGERKGEREGQNNNSN